MQDNKQIGRCACGGVRFALLDRPTEVVACHCRTCRRSSGYYWGAIRARRKDLCMRADNTLRWYASSDAAERGFCSNCGSSLFFRRHTSEWISIAPGAFDDATGLRTVAHICCEEAGDYYCLDDGAPAHNGAPHDV